MPSKLNRIIARFTDSEIASMVKTAGRLTLANYLRRLAGFPPLHHGAKVGNKSGKGRKKKQDNV